MTRLVALAVVLGCLQTTSTAVAAETPVYCEIAHGGHALVFYGRNHSGATITCSSFSCEAALAQTAATWVCKLGPSQPILDGTDRLALGNCRASDKVATSLIGVSFTCR